MEDNKKVKAFTLTVEDTVDLSSIITFAKNNNKSLKSSCDKFLSLMNSQGLFDISQYTVPLDKNKKVL